MVFFLFEYLYNREGSLQGYKTSKNCYNFNLKQYSNKENSKLQSISLIFYLSKKRKKKKSYNKSVKLHLYYSTQKYDESLTRYFPFSKREFPQKPNVVLT